MPSHPTSTAGSRIKIASWGGWPRILPPGARGGAKGKGNRWGEKGAKNPTPTEYVEGAGRRGGETGAGPNTGETRARLGVQGGPEKQTMGAATASGHRDGRGL